MKTVTFDDTKWRLVPVGVCVQKAVEPDGRKSL